VQRLPVRILLEPQQLKEHPLLIGLSMRVEVELRDTRGEQLAAAPRVAPAWAPAALTAQMDEAEARVKAIIAANLGGARLR